MLTKKFHKEFTCWFESRTVKLKGLTIGNTLHISLPLNKEGVELCNSLMQSDIKNNNVLNPELSVRVEDNGITIMLDGNVECTKEEFERLEREKQEQKEYYRLKKKFG